MTNKSQNTRILEHLLKGNTITPLEALGVFGVYRLASRINDLRKSGHAIETTIKDDKHGHHYAEYKLVTNVYA